MKFRKAERKDVPQIMEMHSKDILGKFREEYREPLPVFYYDAFEKIQSDPNQELWVIEDERLEVIGTMQLSFLQYLIHKGGLRAQIEAVVIREDQRGKGMGEKFFQWAIARAKEKGAHVVQLTTDKQRKDAVRFYEKLGFKPSHEGMKLHL